MSETLEQFLARSRAERVARGGTEHLEDGPTLDRIVAIVANINAKTECRDARPA
jgi:hypothetical protein